MTKKKIFILVAAMILAGLFMGLMFGIFIIAIGSIHESSYQRVLVKTSGEYIKTDEYFIDKYGQPISVVAASNDDFEQIKDGECVITYIVKTDSHMTYSVKLRVNYENSDKVYTYDEVVIVKSTV